MRSLLPPGARGALFQSTRPGRLRWAAVLVMIALALAVPPLSKALEGFYQNYFPDVTYSSRFAVFLATTALVLGLWAVSYNLMLGYTGIVSFAHAAYYGVGAYTVAILFDKWHWSLFWGLAAAPFVAGLTALVTGLISLRAARLYFSLLTLAISQILFAIVFQWTSLTGGDNGINGLVPPGLISDPVAGYYFIAAVVLICLTLMFVLVRSPFGAALAAIRENRLRASAVGINVKAYELAVFTAAGAFGGVAGGLYSIYNLDVTPGLFFWTENATPVVITLLGGTLAFMGPALGAFVYTWLSNTITSTPAWANYFDVVLGAIVLAIVLVAPGGVSSLPSLWWRLRTLYRRREEQEAPSASPLIESQFQRSHERSPQEPGEVLLEIRGLSKSFGGLHAVRGVDLTVRTGDRHAIIGPNGAGKSTLFNLITGRIRPDAGSVVFGGRDITHRSAHGIARAGVGRSFQVTSIFPKLTVRQNVQYSMQAGRGATVKPFGLSDRLFRSEALEVVSTVGLEALADIPAGQLSHGDQRALELAISLALGSRLLLLDEPTAGMSSYETVQAMDLVRHIAAERGLTLLFCEHDMDVVFGTARVITVMHLGQVLAQGTPEQIRSNRDVQRVYLGELEDAG